MWFKFKKSIKIVPWVKVNLSKSWVSTTVWVKWASVNFNNKWTYLNMWIPWTWIYDRKKISSNNINNIKEDNISYIAEKIKILYDCLEKFYYTFKGL
jgi:hypothetical protein